MIFYFSGTGNSLYAAKKIGEYIGDTIMNITVALHEDLHFDFAPGETIGFVFPIYAWSAPKMVFDFIRRINVKGHYIFAVGTYGQNIGRFDSFFEKAGIHLNGAFSLNMPNNYLLIWNKEKQDRCLERADKRITEICEAIYQRLEQIDIRCELNGMPATEEQVSFAPNMNAQWSQTLCDTSEFYVTDACVGCGTCEKVCNGKTIRIENKRPTWHDNCTKCLACLHLCPMQAIQFGQYTVGAGRYKNPKISTHELMINTN